MNRRSKMKKLLFSLFSLLFLVSCGGGDDGNSSASSHSALCNDGTYSDSKSCSGTCSSHGGVKEWYVNCGNSASKFSLSIGGNGSSEHKTGLWIGTWINKKDNLAGTIRLNITEKTLITGTFFNGDNTPNANLHSYIDDNGPVRLFLDTQQSSIENTIEYQADISLNNSNDQLMGSIIIQKMANEEIREVELHRE